MPVAPSPPSPPSPQRRRAAALAGAAALALPLLAGAAHWLGSTPALPPLAAAVDGLDFSRAQALCSTLIERHTP
jgi:hypothetical protein